MGPWCSTVDCGAVEVIQGTDRTHAARDTEETLQHRERERGRGRESEGREEEKEGEREREREEEGEVFQRV